MNSRLGELPIVVEATPLRVLMSLATSRYIVAKPTPNELAAANHLGPRPDHKVGSWYRWAIEF
jgi:hypothetical protein